MEDGVEEEAGGVGRVFEWIEGDAVGDDGGGYEIEAEVGGDCRGEEEERGGEEREEEKVLLLR